MIASLLLAVLAVVLVVNKVKEAREAKRQADARRRASACGSGSCVRPKVAVTASPC